MLYFWIFVFVISLVALVKSSDWLVTSAERIGLALGLSPFIVGVTIVGIGTAFPELISSLAAVVRGVPEVVAAHVIGSTIANIFLIIGASAVIARRLLITKSFIDVDLPFIALTTIFIVGVAYDQIITFGESCLLLVVYGIYLLYTIKHEDNDDPADSAEVLPSRIERRAHVIVTASESEMMERPRISGRDIALIALGILGLALGARYLIEALVQLSNALGVPTGVIAISAVAIGTSLPELFVSARAAYHRKSDVALGNIFGSNIFNATVVIGISGLFGSLPVDDRTLAIGIPALAAATLLLLISGISRRIHIWEGMMFLLAYAFFIAKLCNVI